MPRLRANDERRQDIAESTEQPSAAQQAIGDVAPKLADLTDEVLFGDVWERPGLSKRDRSLVIVSALVALYRGGQLNFHLTFAMDNGLTEAELVEALTHLAFYARWPGAMDGLARLKALRATGPQKETT